MNIFGVGLPEMILILAVALLVFGPKRLPEIGRTIAKTLKMLQDASKEFETELKKETEQIKAMVDETPQPQISGDSSQADSQPADGSTTDGTEDRTNDVSGEDDSRPESIEETDEPQSSETIASASQDVDGSETEQTAGIPVISDDSQANEPETLAETDSDEAALDNIQSRQSQQT